MLGVFLLVELVISSLELRGPFLDEGIYITAGLRTLQGHGVSDDYMSWFSGSLLWPAIAGIGWKVAGLAGARAAAALCVTAGMLGALKATGNLLGARVRAGGALAALTSGPVIALGHLAVYDTLAVGAAGLSFWALTEFFRRDDRAWLCAAALLYALAGLAKYPVLIFMASPTLLLVVIVRGRRAALDLGLFVFVAGAVLLIYFTADRAQLAAFETFRVQDNPSFDVTRAQILYSQLYLTIVPLTLALAGVRLLRGRRRIGVALLTGVLGAPAYHLFTGNPAGDQKHVVFGIIFLTPLIGVTVSHALQRHRALAAVTLAGLSVFALSQVIRIDEGWPDLRAPSAYLVKHVKPGERLLANSSWVLAAYLYDAKRISNPYDIYDVSRTAKLGSSLNVCAVQWFVEVPGGESWPASMRRAMRDCGTFHLAYHSQATVTGLGRNLRFVTYSAPIEIWRNTPTERLARAGRSSGAPARRATGTKTERTPE